MFTLVDMAAFNFTLAAIVTFLVQWVSTGVLYIRCMNFTLDTYMRTYCATGHRLYISVKGCNDDMVQCIVSWLGNPHVHCIQYG